MKDPLEPYLEATRRIVRDLARQTGTPEALLSPQDDLEAVARAVGVLVTPPTPRPVLVPLRPTDEFTMDRATEPGPFDSMAVVDHQPLPGPRRCALPGPGHVHCPDGGYCHHQCRQACHRVQTSGPLSGVYPEDRWPEAVRQSPAPVLSDPGGRVSP